MTTFDLHKGNALHLIKGLPDNSVHLVATDPPYFIDGMGDDWDKNTLGKRTSRAGVVGGLPTGMKFDPQQGRKFQEFMFELSKEVHRVLKPGGFYLSFSQARLYHRMAVAIEDAGFEIRDMMAWKYEGQAKAFSMDHFVRKMPTTASEKARIIAELGGRKTPQLKPQMEPIALAQKPKCGTFIENWMRYETGLVDVKASLDDKFPGNIMEVKKPSKEEKGDGNEHLTVKPIALMEHLIRLFSKEGQTVLDPFNGSGTTGIACLNTGRHYIGFELEQEYINITNKRVQNAIK